MNETEMEVFPEGLMQEDDENSKRREARKTFSRIGWAFFAMMVSGIFFQMIVSAIYTVCLSKKGIELNGTLLGDFMTFATSLVPMYLVGIPVLYALIKPLPKKEIQRKKFGFGSMVKFFIISLPLTYIGNIIGMGIAEAIGNLTGKNPINGLSELIGSTNPWMNFLFVVLIGPFIEELLFRKFLIDRTVRFGERNAVVLSAIMFGLFHMNLFQLFYATALGFVFGYIYVKTGKIRYTYGLHAVINFLGAIVATLIIDPEELKAIQMLQEGRVEEISPNLMLPVVLFSLYTLFLFVASIVGIILMIKGRKKVRFDETGAPFERKVARQLTYGNLGMAFFTAVSIVMIVSSMMMQLK